MQTQKINQMSKSKFFNISLLLGFTLIVSSLFGQDSEITVDELKSHIYFLADDSLKGRKPGTEEGRISAEYIRNSFESSGLKTIGENGFQFFDVTTRVKPGENNFFTFEERTFEHDSDFVVMPFSTNTKLKAEVIFAGFGIETDLDSLKWNDYENLEVGGKLLMILRGDPEPDNDESLFIPYAGDRDKVLLARDKGAVGVLFVNGPQFGNMKFAKALFSRVTADAGIPVINISSTLANEILKSNGITIDSLENTLISSKKTNSFVIGKEVSFQTDLVKESVTTQNVVAILEGNDPLLKDEFIVIGAHYDHLGFGGPGSGSRMPDTIAVHNGADDNASGVAGILELAQKLSSQKENLKRSILFMAFGAEEMGLIGSHFFTNNLLVDLKQIKIMINFDMIGRMDSIEKGLVIGGTGTAVEMEDLLKTYEEKSQISFTHSPEGYGSSDHASFYASGVPVLFFFTGAHTDYHTPFDDADLVNYEGEKEILDFAYPIILEFATTNQSLTYQEAEQKGPKRNIGRGLKVKFGIMPDFTSTENDGLGVGGVTKGGPAHKGGMLKGDKIVAINGMTVSNIYDYMARLKKLEPNQTVLVDIIRAGEKKVLVIVL